MGRSSFIIKIIGINVAALGFYVCIRHYGFPQWPWLVYLGSISLNIYLAQGLILELTPKDWNGYFSFLFIVTISVAVALIMKQSRKLAKYINYKCNNCRNI